MAARKSTQIEYPPRECAHTANTPNSMFVHSIYIALCIYSWSVYFRICVRCVAWCAVVQCLLVYAAVVRRGLSSPDVETTPVSFRAACKISARCGRGSESLRQWVMGKFAYVCRTTGWINTFTYAITASLSMSHFVWARSRGIEESSLFQHTQTLNVIDGCLNYIFVWQMNWTIISPTAHEFTTTMPTPHLFTPYYI